MLYHLCMDFNVLRPLLVSVYGDLIWRGFPILPTYQHSRLNKRLTQRKQISYLQLNNTCREHWREGIRTSPTAPRTHDCFSEKSNIPSQENVPPSPCSHATQLQRLHLKRMHSRRSCTPHPNERDQSLHIFP